MEEKAPRPLAGLALNIQRFGAGPSMSLETNIKGKARPAPSLMLSGGSFLNDTGGIKVKLRGAPSMVTQGQALLSTWSASCLWEKSTAECFALVDMDTQARQSTADIQQRTETERGNV